LVGIISILPTIEADQNFSISQTSIYSLDIYGNCELLIISRVKNIGDDFVLQPNMYLSIPVSAVSYSDEQPKVTMVTVGDVNAKFYIKYYNVTYLPGTNSFRHDFNIEIYPPCPTNFSKNIMITYRAKSIINKSTSEFEYHNRFTIPSMDLPIGEPPFENLEHFTIRVNLPNNPYYWVETLDTKAQYDFRSPFGRGESLEWWYDGNDKKTNIIYLDYRIHPDPLRQELDKATKQSRDISDKSLIISLIALGIAIKDKRKKLHWVVGRIWKIFKEVTYRIIEKTK